MEVFVSSALLAVLVLIQLILVILEASLNLRSHLFSFFAKKKNLLIKFVMWQEVEREVASLCNLYDQKWQWRGICVVGFLHFTAIATAWHKCVSMRTIIWQQTTGEIWAMAGWVNSHSKRRWQNILWRGSETSITLTDPILPAIHHHSPGHLQPEWLKRYDNMELAQ